MERAAEATARARDDDARGGGGRERERERERGESVSGDDGVSSGVRGVRCDAGDVADDVRRVRGRGARGGGAGGFVLETDSGAGVRERVYVYAAVELFTTRGGGRSTRRSRRGVVGVER